MLFVVFGLLAATIGISSPVVAQTPNYDAAVSASSPSHWWKLNTAAPNATAVDSVGNVDGVYDANAVSAAGISSTAAVFGVGGNERLALDGATTRFSELTAELWFKPGIDTNTTRQRMLRHGTHGYHLDWLPALSAVTANVSLETPDNEEWDNIELMAVGIDPNEWHHVAVVVDTTKIGLWVDGNELDTFEFSASNAVGVYYTGDLLTIGNDVHVNRGYTGSLDEVAIYDRALSGTDIQNHYTATGRTIIPPAGQVNSSAYAASVIASDPIAYWQLDDDTNATTIVDSIDPTANNAGISSQRPDFGQPGVFADSTAIAFNSRSETLNLPGTLLADLDDAFTIEMWLKSGSTSGWDRAIRARSYGFGIDWDGGNQRFQAWLHTTDGSAPIIHSNPVSLNQWHHVALVFDGTEIRLVVNGELQDVDAAGDTARYSGTLLTLANDYPGYRKGRDFNGAIDQVAFYDHALPTTEIRGHYTASGRMSAVPLNTNEVINECINEGGNVYLAEPTSAEINGQTSTYAPGCYYFEDCIGTQTGATGWAQSVSCSHPVITSLALTTGVSLIAICIISGACLTLVQPAATGAVAYGSGTAFYGKGAVLTAAVATALVAPEGSPVSTAAIAAGTAVVVVASTVVATSTAILIDVVTHDETDHAQDIAIYGTIENGLAPSPADIKRNTDSPTPIFIEPEFLDENGDYSDDPEEAPSQFCPDNSKRPEAELPPLAEGTWDHIIDRHNHENSDAPDFGDPNGPLFPENPDQFYEAADVADYPYDPTMSGEFNTKNMIALLIYSAFCWGDEAVNNEPVVGGFTYTVEFPTFVGLEPGVNNDTKKVRIVVDANFEIWTAFPLNPGDQ